jgi:glycosyltransferase involved in cell wall biosynthesis
MTVIDALALLPEQVSLSVVGYETVGHSGYVETLLERARALHVAHRLEWRGQVPTRAELLEHARECDVGLALMPMRGGDENERTMAGASNKPFDYMASGLGLIVSDLEDWRAMFVQNGFARACNSDDAASIAEAVCWYLEHPIERQRQSQDARLRILSEWNYETQFAPVRAEFAKGGM